MLCNAVRKETIKMSMPKNGYYSNQKIYIDADSDESVINIIGRNLVHSIELTDEYLKLLEMIIRKIQNDDGDLAAMRKEIYERYLRNGVRLDSSIKIDQTLIAEYAQAHLFPDEESLVSVLNADKEVGNKLHLFLYKALAMLGNKKARERVFTTEARAIFALALRNSKEQYL